MKTGHFEMLLTLRHIILDELIKSPNLQDYPIQYSHNKLFLIKYLLDIGRLFL